MRFLALAVLALGISATASAQDDDSLCRNGLFAEENAEFALARIGGEGRAHFISDSDGCPDSGRSCSRAAYAVPGDQVVVGRVRGAYSCVFYPNRSGGSAGWIPNARLQGLPVNRSPLSGAWLGEWVRDESASLKFKRKQGSRALVVSGDAYWPSPDPPPSLRPYGPNLGSVDGAVVLQGNRAEQSECAICFILLNDILVVADPKRHCDGMNVTFSGVYHRSRD